MGKIACGSLVGIISVGFGSGVFSGSVGFGPRVGVKKIVGEVVGLWWGVGLGLGVGFRVGFGG